MKIKSVIVTVLKLVFLTVLLFICFSIAAKVAAMPERNIAPQEAQEVALLLLGICFAFTLTLSYPIIRSQWRGWRLILTMMAAFFGVMTFLSQIESLIFLNYLVKIISLELIGKIILQGAVLTVLFIPLAVGVWGKMRGASAPSPKLQLPWREWAWKLAVLSVSYFIIYLSFGYFVAWQSPAVREYYQGLIMPAWMPFFQLVRALVWVAIAVPVIKMMDGRAWEAGLAVGLLYAVLMSFLLLMPENVVMPDGVRLAHFREVCTSNFLFGWLVVGVLNLGKKAKKGRIDIQM